MLMYALTSAIVASAVVKSVGERHMCFNRWTGILSHHIKVVMTNVIIQVPKQTENWKDQPQALAKQHWSQTISHTW